MKNLIAGADDGINYTNDIYKKDIRECFKKYIGKKFTDIK